mgnify:CR=1 FL=1
MVMATLMVTHHHYDYASLYLFPKDCHHDYDNMLVCDYIHDRDLRT